MSEFNEFLGDEVGAVTIDWVAITAVTLVLGIGVVYAIFNGGMASAVGGISAFATDLTSIDVGAPPDPVTFGG